MKKTLVLGGTGTVGGMVVDALQERNVPVSILTRDPAKVQRRDVEAVAGDLTKPRELGAAFEGVDALFLLAAVSLSETQEGLVALEWAKRAQVRKLVYLSVHNVHDAPHLPHFGSKVAIEHAIMKSGLDYTILQPNNFYQNDYWFKDVILNYGIYPQPLGDIGISRVDVRDIADAAANAFTADGHTNETYVLAGPEVLTGGATADTYSRHLGRTIRYAGNDLDAWEQQALSFFPDWMTFDFKMMFGYFQQNGLAATAEDLRKTENVVGHPARRFDDFVRETVADWLKQ